MPITPYEKKVELNITNDTTTSSSSSSKTNNRTANVILPIYIANFSLSNVAIIVTHPWGPLGGNCHHPLIMAIVLFFQQLQCTTIRFDFLDKNQFISNGMYQIRQIQWIIQYALMQQSSSSPSIPIHDNSRHDSKNDTNHDNNEPARGHPPPKYIILIGYSYGAIISGSAASIISTCTNTTTPKNHSSDCYCRIVGSIMISPPFGVMHWLVLFHRQFHLRQMAGTIVDSTGTGTGSDTHTSSKSSSNISALTSIMTMMNCHRSTTASTANKNEESTIIQQQIHRLVVIGDLDSFTSEATFIQYMEKYFYNKSHPMTSTTTTSTSSSTTTTTTSSTTTTGAIMKNVDHFYTSKTKIKDLIHVIASWLATTFHTQLLQLQGQQQQVQPQQSSSSSQPSLLYLSQLVLD